MAMSLSQMRAAEKTAQINYERDTQEPWGPDFSDFGPLGFGVLGLGSLEALQRDLVQKGLRVFWSFRV